MYYIGGEWCLLALERHLPKPFIDISNKNWSLKIHLKSPTTDSSSVHKSDFAIDCGLRKPLRKKAQNLNFIKADRHNDICLNTLAVF